MMYGRAGNEMKKIKLAMLCPYPINEIRGGVEMHVYNLVNHIALLNDIELHIITLGSSTENFKNGNIHFHIIKKFKFRYFRILDVIKVKKVVLKINPDIVHAMGTIIPYSTAASFFINRCPTVLTILGVVKEEIKFYKGIDLIFGILLHRPNERYVVSKIPHITVQSPYIKNLISRVTNSKIYVVPEGIGFERIQDTQPPDLNEKIDIFIAVNFRWLKGVDILIKAIPEVLRSVPDLKAYIAGSGEEEEKLKSMVKDLGLESNVKFLGYISDEEEINRYYKACKIVVVPSRWDVDPFAPLNAAASGKPTIVSDMCNSSVIEDGKTGFVFKSEDVDELSSKMVKLLTDDELREEMGKAAMEKVKEYDWSKIVDKKVEIYKEVIADFHERKRRKKENGKHL